MLWVVEQKKRVFWRSTSVSLVLDLAALSSSFKQTVIAATILFNYEAIFIILLRVYTIVSLIDLFPHCHCTTGHKENNVP